MSAPPTFAGCWDFSSRTGWRWALGGRWPRRRRRFRTNATGLDWAQLGEPVVPIGGMFSATNLIRFALQRVPPTRVIYICLGPLTNLGDALKQTPELAEAISTVLWFGTPPNAAQPGWNARRDEAALKQIAGGGPARGGDSLAGRSGSASGGRGAAG